MIIHSDKRAETFSRISNALLRDQRLSYRARGVAAYLLTNEANWEFSGDRLARTGPEGRDAMREAIRELEQYGYVVREKQRDPATGQFRTVLVLREQPHTDDGFPGVGETGASDASPQVAPTTGYQASENQASVNQASVFQASKERLSRSSLSDLSGSSTLQGALDHQDEVAALRVCESFAQSRNIPENSITEHWIDQALALLQLAPEAVLLAVIQFSQQDQFWRPKTADFTGIQKHFTTLRQQESAKQQKRKRKTAKPGPTRAPQRTAMAEEQDELLEWVLSADGTAWEEAGGYPPGTFASWLKETSNKERNLRAVAQERDRWRWSNMTEEELRRAAMWEAAGF